jgi:hypothetical protein
MAAKTSDLGTGDELCPALQTNPNKTINNSKARNENFLKTEKCCSRQF